MLSHHLRHRFPIQHCHFVDVCNFHGHLDLSASALCHHNNFGCLLLALAAFSCVSCGTLGMSGWFSLTGSIAVISIFPQLFLAIFSPQHNCMSLMPQSSHAGQKLSVLCWYCDYKSQLRSFLKSNLVQQRQQWPSPIYFTINNHINPQR